MLVDPLCGRRLSVIDWLAVDQLLAAEIERLEQRGESARYAEAVAVLRAGLEQRAAWLRYWLSN